MRLNENDWLGINNILLKMYSDAGTKLFDNSLMKNLQYIMPYDYASLYLHDYETDRGLCKPEGFGFEEGILEEKRVDKIVPHSWVNFDDRCQVVRLSDLYDKEEQLRLPYYQELFQKYRICYELTLSLAHKNRRVGVLTLFRCDSDQDFTDREVSIAEQIIGHIACYAYQTYGMDQYFGKTETNKNDYDLEALVNKYGLSQRESEVLQSMLEGKPIREAADTLCLSETTIKKHSHSIYEKMNISGRSELFRVVLGKQ